MVRISVKAIPFTRGDVRRYNYSVEKLTRYEPPFVANAEKEISKMLGVKDLRLFEVNHAFLTKAAFDAQSEGELSYAKEVLFSPIFGATDLKLKPELYSGLNTAILKYCDVRGLAGKNILEAGSNWGPFMHYLKHEHGANVFGVDINKIAVEYAKRGGLNFTMGDASKMDFYKDNSFDIVVSRNFLIAGYLRLFCHNGQYRDPFPFMNKVIKEIYRILRPGGLYFSNFEDMGSIDASKDLFGSFDRMELSGYEWIDILKK